MKAGIPSSSFADALKRGDRAALRAFPKADRHCHSLLGASLRSIREWTGRPIADPPARMAGFDGMRRYAHAQLYPYIRNRAGVEFTAERTIEEAILDGVRILELSFDVDFAPFFDNGMDGFFSFIARLLAAYGDRILFLPEIGLSKNRPPESRIASAMECIASGLFKSIDLYGNEDAQPPEAYSLLYGHAKTRGLKLKAHVGEFGDAGLVERTLRTLHLDEIQHGVAAASSGPLMETLARERIRLNVCPGSNVALSVAGDLAHHPVGILVRNGVRVSVNSDDKTIFGRTVTEEYSGLYDSGVLGAEELDGIRLDSLRE